MISQPSATIPLGIAPSQAAAEHASRTGGSSMDMIEVLWNRMTAAELTAAAASDAIVLLPAASTEQHGPHLATGVDTFLGHEGCRRLALRVAERRPIVVAPTIWMGLAEHHVAFGGTFSVSLATYSRPR